MGQEFYALHSKQMVWQLPRLNKWILVGSLVGLLAWAAPVMADGGSVLPSSDQPLGYSLADLAAATAVYNTGVNSGNPATPAPPNIPFQVLVGDAAVGAGTYLYLPIFFADNSAPVDPNFPPDITNQSADAAYLDNVVLTGFGVTAFLVQVDGQTTVLDDTYISGVPTPTLLDGTPGGTDYIVSAAVVSPLDQGDHVVGIGGLIGGSPVIFASYSVSVPEPGAIGMLGMAVVALIRRRNRV
jgi:PEP-CTERM motif